MNRSTIQKGIYRHNKTGKLYEVLGIALQTESNEQLVVYRPLDNTDYELFARPHSMFVEMVKLEDAMKPRFEKVDDRIDGLDYN